MSNEPTDIPVEEEKTAPLLYTEKSKVAYISINTKMNAINIELAKQLVSLLKQADENPKINVIVIKSEGTRVFSAGFDLRMFSQGISMDILDDLLEFGGAISKTIFFCKKPVIAQIQGSAIGLGAIIALSSDFRFVANRVDLFFQLPEVDINMFPATGPMSMALRVLGVAHAQEMLITGRKVPLKEFDKWGAVTQIVELEELKKTVRKFAKNLAQKPSNLVHSIKSAINMMSYDQASRWYELENNFARYNVKVLGNLEHPPIDTFLADMWKEFTAGKSQ